MDRDLLEAIPTLLEGERVPAAAVVVDDEPVAALLPHAPSVVGPDTFLAPKP